MCTTTFVLDKHCITCTVHVCSTAEVLLLIPPYDNSEIPDYHTLFIIP